MLADMTKLGRGLGPQLSYSSAGSRPCGRARRVAFRPNGAGDRIRMLSGCHPEGGPMTIVIRVAEQDRARAWGILVRHSPGTALPNNTFLVSEGAARRLRGAG